MDLLICFVGFAAFATTARTEASRPSENTFN